MKTTKVLIISLIGIIIMVGIFFGVVSSLKLVIPNATLENKVQASSTEITPEFTDSAKLKAKFFYGGDISKMVASKTQNGENPKELLKLFTKEFNEKLDSVFESLTIQPTNARVIFDGENKETPFTYISEGDGQKVDKLKSLQSLTNSIINKTSATVHYIPIKPTETTDSLKEKTKLLASFSTNYSTCTDNKKHNIKLASKMLNGTIILPKKDLSFNEIVGERSESRGFKESKIIVNGEYIDGFGGGVCQVSSTIFNAWLLANLTVKESRNHSLPTSYLPLGFDATVSNTQDLRVTNCGDYEIYLQLIATENDLTVNVFGKKCNQTITLENKKIRDFIPSPEYEIFGDGNEIEYIQNPTIGSEVDLIKTTYENNVIVKQEIIRKSYYASKSGKIFTK